MMGRRGRSQPWAAQTGAYGVVIPAKDEAKNLPYVLPGLPRDSYEMILVDGDSTDGTAEVTRRLRPDVTIIGQSRKGKGNALACGFAGGNRRFHRDVRCRWIERSAEIPRFVNALKVEADFAKGSRFPPGAGRSDISRRDCLSVFELEAGEVDGADRDATPVRAISTHTPTASAS